MKRVLAALLLITACLLPACSNSAEARDVREKIAAAARSVATWTSSEWDKLTTSSGEKIRTLTRELEGVGEAAKSKLGPLWKKVESAAEAAKSEFAKLEGKGREAWDAAKGEVRDAVVALEGALEEARKALGK